MLALLARSRGLLLVMNPQAVGVCAGFRVSECEYMHARVSRNRLLSHQKTHPLCPFLTLLSLVVGRPFLASLSVSQCFAALLVWFRLAIGRGRLASARIRHICFGPVSMWKAGRAPFRCECRCPAAVPLRASPPAVFRPFTAHCRLFEPRRRRPLPNLRFPQGPPTATAYPVRGLFAELTCLLCLLQDSKLSRSTIAHRLAASTSGSACRCAAMQGARPRCVDYIIKFSASATPCPMTLCFVDCVIISGVDGLSRRIEKRAAGPCKLMPSRSRSYSKITERLPASPATSI